MNYNLIDELISEISINSLSKLNFSESSIYLFEHDTQTLIQKSLLLINENIIDFTPINFQISVGIIGETANELIPKIQNSILELNSQISKIAVPIVYSNKLLGVIYAKQLSKNYFDQKHISILSTIASICALKIDKIQSEISKEKLSLELLELVKINQLGQLNSLFQVTIDAVVVIDENLQIINWNNIAEQIFGWSALEVIGNNLNETILFNEYNNKDQLSIYFDEESKKEPNKNKLLELTVINKESKKIEVSMGISKTSYQNNNIFIAYFRDITERKRAEEFLKKSKESAEVASKSKTDFLANMSHEIRTPMNAIIGFSELLFNSIKDEKQKSQVNTIRLAAKNLLTIINDILDLSKIESGKMELQLEKTNLSKLVKEIEIILIQSAVDKGLVIHTKTESISNFLLLIDSLRLKQILINLVGNAIKFTSKGQVKVTIEEINNYNNEKIDLFISVEDTGIGIPLNQLDLIFEQFSQKKGQDVKSYGGTGLGLAISKKLVELMGGELIVASTLDVGSTFSFYLPNIEIVEIIDHLNVVDEVTFNDIKFKKAKILIADDLITNRDLIKDILSNSPFEFYETDNGQDAIEIATSLLPDLIILDLRMPIMNGFEATKILKNNDKTKQIPIIAVTASAFMVLNKNNEVNIFDDYITKPIDINHFIEVLKKYLKEENLEMSKEVLIQNVKTEQKLSKREVNEIIKYLEMNFQPSISIALENQVIDEIEKIGNEIIEYGSIKSINLIIEYGKKIITFVDNFEVEKLLNILNLFPELILNIKEKTR